MSPEEYMRDQLAKQPGVYAGITEESVYNNPPIGSYAGATEESVYRSIGGSALKRVSPNTLAKTPDISATLAERGGRYGKFIDHSQISQGMQDVMRAAPNWDKLDVDMRQALTTIVDKIARILNGDPYYDDSWHDISGYATLVERRLLEEKAPQ